MWALGLTFRASPALHLCDPPSCKCSESRLDLHEYLVQVPALLSNAAHRYCFPLKDLARDDLGSGSFVVLMARPREIVRLLTSAIEALEAVILRHGNREPAGAG